MQELNTQPLGHLPRLTTAALFTRLLTHPRLVKLYLKLICYFGHLHNPLLGGLHAQICSTFILDSV